MEEGSSGDLVDVMFKARLLSKMTLRLRLWGDGDREELSMVRWKLSVVLVRDLGPIMMKV